MIQKATKNQTEEIVRFFDKNQHNESNNGFVSSSVIESQINKGLVDIYIKHNKIVGVSIYSKNYKTLFNILVLKDFRKMGIGTKLISYRNPEFIRCKTNMKTGNPEKFYNNNNYKTLGEVKKGIVLMSKHQKTIYDF